MTPWSEYRHSHCRVCRVACINRIDGHLSRLDAAGGGSRIQQTIEAGLLDELQIHLVPVLLGDGFRLFSRPDVGGIELERTRVVESPAVTHLRFLVDQ